MTMIGYVAKLAGFTAYKQTVRRGSKFDPSVSPLRSGAWWTSVFRSLILVTKN